MVRLEPGALQGGYGEGDRVRPAEAVRAEGLDGLPDLVPHGRAVATRACQAVEPVPDPRQPVLVAERPPGDLRHRPVAAGHHMQRLDDLLVPDGHAVGVGEDRFEVRVGVGGCATVAGGDVPLGHAPGDRAGTEEADVGDDVLRVTGLQPGQQVLLTGRLQLEQAQGLALLDELEREDVVERHLPLVVQVDAVAGGSFDLRDGVRHGGLHPHTQDVELDVAQRFDLLLRGHGHGVVALRGGLHR